MITYLNHFTQPDSIVPDPYNPQDWDRYSYARNNPIRYTDPMGHRVCEGESNSGCKPAPTEIKVPYFVKSPVDKKHLKFTQWFGPTEFAYSNGKDWNYDKYCQGYHCGIDFGADWGDPVYAGIYGQVYEKPGKGVGGYQVVIQTGDYFILYQALDGNFQVKEGDFVTPDTILAGVGNHAADKNAGNYHLHLEVMHYSSYAVEHHSYWSWHGDLIENPLLFMNRSVYDLLNSVVDTSAYSAVHFHSEEQDPLQQPSPIHRGGPVLWP